jgi:hypothetical protein
VGTGLHKKRKRKKNNFLFWNVILYGESHFFSLRNFHGLWVPISYRMWCEMYCPKGKGSELNGGNTLQCSHITAKNSCAPRPSRRQLGISISIYLFIQYVYTDIHTYIHTCGVDAWRPLWYSVYLLYWYKSTNTDAEGAARHCLASFRSQLSLLSFLPIMTTTTLPNTGTYI